MKSVSGNVTVGSGTTLRGYFITEFAPDRLAGKDRVYRHQFLSAITLLECVKCSQPGKLLIDEITDDDLDEMRRRCIAQEYAPITVTKYRWLLRMILKQARPDRFPALSGRWTRRRDEPEPIDEPGTLWHFLQHTYAPYRLVGRNQGSREQFDIAVRGLLRFTRKPGLGILDLTDDLLMDFAAELSECRMSNDTINNRLAKLRALWRFSVKRKLRIDHPDNERLPRHKRLPTAWTMEQLGRLLATCVTQQGTIGVIPASRFWSALILVLYDSGIRFRSAVLLPWSAIDLRSRWLTVPAELMKNRAEQRFYLHEQTIEAISEIRRPKRELLFPVPMHKRTFYKLYHRLLRKAGLPDSRRDLFHRIRRTSATHLAAAVGVEQACRHLGHSALSVTMGYIDNSLMPGVRAGEVLPRPERNGAAK